MYSRVLLISITSQRKGELSPHLARARDCLAVTSVSTVDQENTVVWALHSSPPVLTSQKATGNAKGDEWAVLNVTSVARVELVHTGV